MATSVDKSVVVTLSADEISRLEGLVGAGAYETLDDIVREAVHHWLGAVEKPQRVVKSEPVFVLRAHVRDVLARNAKQPEVRISESFEALGLGSSDIESAPSQTA